MGILSRTSGDALEFVGDSLGSLEPAEFDDEGREVVQCRSCHDQFAIADDELVPLGADKDQDLVEVPKDDLEAALEFLADDPALDGAPEGASVVAAIRTLEDRCDPQNPRYAEVNQQ